jgi:hypothetical protein
MEAIRSSETSDKTGTTRCYTPEEDILLYCGFHKSEREPDINFMYSPAINMSLGADTDKATLFVGPHFLYYIFDPFST